MVDQAGVRVHRRSGVRPPPEVIIACIDENDDSKASDEDRRRSMSSTGFVTRVPHNQLPLSARVRAHQKCWAYIGEARPWPDTTACVVR